MGSSPLRTACRAILAIVSVAWAVIFLISRDHHRAASPIRERPSARPEQSSDLRGATPGITNRTVTAGSNNDDNPFRVHRRRSLLFSGIRLERTTYKLPAAVERNLMDLDVLPSAGGTDEDHSLPIFWHVLKSGGTTVKLMYAQCYRLVEACETGVLIDANQRSQQQQQQLQPQQQQQPEPEPAPLATAEEGAQDHPSPWEWMQQQQQQQAQVDANVGHQRRLEPMPWAPPDENQQLRIVSEEDGRKYVNVDTTTPEGILQASQLGFASSNLADVMFTPLLLESAESLLAENSGRMFAIFRHPVDRVVSIFHYLQGATWEPTYDPAYAGWTIHDYARSDRCESNWMVRSLTGKMEGPLSGDDIGVAMEVLRRKCLVGLMEGMDESVRRFGAYFGWREDEALRCARDRFLSKGSGANSHSHPTLDQASDTWAVLAKKNGLDIRLYEYAQQLFAEQGQWLQKEGIV